jgi:hypothetical protein
MEQLGKRKNREVVDILTSGDIQDLCNEIETQSWEKIQEYVDKVTLAARSGALRLNNEILTHIENGVKEKNRKLVCASLAAALAFGELDIVVKDNAINLLETLIGFARLGHFFVMTDEDIKENIKENERGQANDVRVDAALAVRAAEFMLKDFLKIAHNKKTGTTYRDLVFDYFDNFASGGLQRFFKILEKVEKEKKKYAYTSRTDPVSWIVNLFAELQDVSSHDVPNERDFTVEDEGKTFDFVQAFRSKHPDWKPAMLGDVYEAAMKLSESVQPEVCTDAPKSGFVWHNGEEVKIEAQPEGLEVGTHPYGQTFRTVPVGEKGLSEEVDCKYCMLGDNDGNGPTPRLFEGFLNLD